MSATIPSDVETRAARDTSPWIARAAALVAAAAVVLLLGLLIWGLGKRSAGTVGDAPVVVRPAPSFVLPLFDGGEFRLSGVRGTPVLINFWASWCEPCEAEAAALERASKRYDGRIAFIGIDVQDTDPNARAFLRRFGVSYPNGRDATGEIAVDYGMSGVPETYFVDRDGRVVKKWQGPLDDARLTAFLDQLLQEPDATGPARP